MIRCDWAARCLAGLTLTLTVGLSACSRDETPAPTARPAEETTSVNLKEFDDYIVHFNTLTTDILAPDAARAFGITRSTSRAMLNVHIRKKDDSSFGSPTRGEVTVEASNLTGQIKDLSLRPVTDKPTEAIDEEVIYYIGDFSISNGETVVFDITVVPEGDTRELRLKLSRQFFIR